MLQNKIRISALLALLMVMPLIAVPAFSPAHSAYGIQASIPTEPVSRVYKLPAPSPGPHHGSGAQAPIPGIAANHTVTFTESGLPTGLNWYVSQNGTTSYATSPGNITFSLPDGTYNFTATNLTSYYTSSPSIAVTVDGKNLSENISFQEWAHLTGILSPSNATLKVNGQAVLVLPNGVFNLSLASGSCRIVASEPGYHTYYRNLTMHSGPIVAINIMLQNGTSSQQPGSNAPHLTFTRTDQYLLVAGVVALGIGLTVAALRRRR